MADEKNDQKNLPQADPQPSSDAMLPPESESKPEEKLPFLGFVGSYPHSIDAKGRMIIPAAFRDALGARFAVAPSPDFQAVALYPIADWIRRRDALVALVKRKPVAQPFLDEFTRYSYTDCESDAQGRLLLPQRIRAWRLGDVRDVEVAGAFDHIKIISAAKGQDQDRLFDEKYPDPLAFLTSLMEDE
jgi:MraZ protein